MVKRICTRDERHFIFARFNLRVLIGFYRVVVVVV